MDFIEISIPNWGKYNPRSDRKVHSWFRFQNDFFSDPKLWHLDDTKRCHLVFFFCEISKNFGKSIKLSLDFISHQRKTSSKKILEEIQELANLGVIAVTGMTPKGNATNERTNERRDSPAGAELPRIAVLWNELTPSRPKIKKWNPARDRAIKVLEKTASDFFSEWSHCCRSVEDSDFLSGRNGKWNGCSFDWLTNSKNFVKVLEGNYDNERPLKKAAGDICGVSDV